MVTESFYEYSTSVGALHNDTLYQLNMFHIDYLIRLAITSLMACIEGYLEWSLIRAIPNLIDKVESKVLSTLPNTHSLPSASSPDYYAPSFPYSIL